MEAPRGPGYDDWFDEPEPPTETQAGANRAAYEDVEEVWVLPEEEEPRSGQREFVIAGRTLTLTQVAIIGLSVLAVILALAAALGAFGGGKAATPPVTLPVKHVTVTVQNTTPANTNPTTQFPAGTTLKFSDTGSEVKALQRALISLGFLTGTADGDYGTATQLAVEKFQAAKNLAQDGVAGPQTLQALQQATAGSG